MSQFAELGPLDVQLRKEDEVGDWTSGLTAIEALATLRSEASTLFAEQFRKMRAGREFSTKMATQVARRITTGLLSPIYSQIDPMRLGEIERSVRISSDYGTRLETANVLEGTVERLVIGYASHDFVIDRREAREHLFGSVEKPIDALEILGEAAIRAAIAEGAFASETSTPSMRYMNREEENAKADTGPSDRVNRSSGARTGKGPRAADAVSGQAGAKAVDPGTKGEGAKGETRRGKIS